MRGVYVDPPMIGADGGTPPKGGGTSAANGTAGGRGELALAAPAWARVSNHLRQVATRAGRGRRFPHVVGCHTIGISITEATLGARGRSLPIQLTDERTRDAPVLARRRLSGRKVVAPERVDVTQPRVLHGKTLGLAPACIHAQGGRPALTVSLRLGFRENPGYGLAERRARLHRVEPGGGKVRAASPRGRHRARGLGDRTHGPHPLIPLLRSRPPVFLIEEAGDIPWPV